MNDDGSDNRGSRSRCKRTPGYGGATIWSVTCWNHLKRKPFESICVFAFIYKTPERRNWLLKVLFYVNNWWKSKPIFNVGRGKLLIPLFIYGYVSQYWIKFIYSRWLTTCMSLQSMFSRNSLYYNLHVTPNKISFSRCKCLLLTAG